jgi:hypothetical protein
MSTSAKGSVFSPAAGIAIDSSGTLYITSQIYPNIYEVDNTGAILTISGAGTVPAGDGLIANSTSGFNGAGIHVDSNGDLYVADPGGNAIRKLILNSPVSLTVSDGNNQTGTAGSTLVKALRVVVNGRAGVGVPGVTVNFAVTSGSGTLSGSSSQTDNGGLAGVAVTLGPVAGDVVVTATIAGSKLSPVQFTLTALNSSLTVNSQSLAFSYNVGDPAPAAQTLAVAAQGGGVLPFTITAAVSGDVQWLQIDTATGRTPATVQVSVVNFDILAPGVYVGSITVTSTLNNMAQSVVVQLTVAGATP